jgi:hypothetical protein
MSAPENILARWSRRKLESVEETKPSGTEAACDAPSDMNAASPKAFDPASLPPIESITGSTDIRSFLQSGVPDELMRSALRRAWVTDPAIRDFIGIAENQWNFNDPAAIPGFGPLRTTDEVARLAAQLPDRADNAIGRLAETSASSPQDGLEEKAVAEDHDGPAGKEDGRPR